MVLEGLVTTINGDGSVNLAPMGPLVDAALEQLVLRPYRSSQTYRNLKRCRQGVFHVTDNVEMLALAAIDQLDPLPELVPAGRVEGVVIADACRWYEFVVERVSDRAERTTIACRVVDSGRIRDFFGFNRAKHAVVEAAVLATRLSLMEMEQVRGEFARLAVLVEKTGGAQERRAFELLDKFVDNAARTAACPHPT